MLGASHGLFWTTPVSLPPSFLSAACQLLVCHLVLFFWFPSLSHLCHIRWRELSLPEAPARGVVLESLPPLDPGISDLTNQPVFSEPCPQPLT